MKNVILLCINAQISLIINTWTSRGLVNGNFGVIKDIIYPEKILKDSQPIAIIFFFPDYIGPQFFVDDRTRHNWIPINRRSIYSKLVNGDRTQYPLRLSYALTMHKSQVQTLHSAVIDLGKSEMSLGLTFVALSRLKHISHFLIVPFAYDRLTKIKNSKSLIPRLLEEERLLNLKDQTLKKFEFLIEN